MARRRFVAGGKVPMGIKRCRARASVASAARTSCHICWSERTGAWRSRRRGAALRVLFATGSLSMGGAERQLALLVKYLPPEWERLVWSLHEGPFADVIRHSGTPVLVDSRNSRYDIAPALGLCSAIRHWRPNVVHSWGSWMCALSAAPICRALGIPLVDSSIRNGMRYPRRQNREAAAHRLADCVIANSRVGLDAWAVSPSKGRVLRNAFDFGRLAAISNSRPPARGRITVAMTGRMVPHKDFGSFFAAARTLSRAAPDLWRFVAIGDGPNRTWLEDSARDLIAAGVLTFARPGLEVLPIVAQADVGVLMSNPLVAAEGCSNSIMEYMSVGLPVVCDDNGGNRELVLHGKTGYLVASGDVSRLAERLAQLAGNRQEAGWLGKNGRERLGRVFSVDRLVERQTEIYAALLGRKPRVGGGS